MGGHAEVPPVPKMAQQAECTSNGTNSTTPPPCDEPLQRTCAWRWCQPRARGVAAREEQLLGHDEASLGEIATWCLTGMSGWWALNVISAELPYFVAELPEKEALGNLIAVCTQLGNIAPIAYKALPHTGQFHLTYVIAIFQALAIGTLFLCAVFWDRTIGGHSVFLLLCTALAGSVGCMSNVTYWAAANARPPSCTRAMSVGTTLGGLVATGLSSLQMAGRAAQDPRFSPWLLFTVSGVIQVVMAVVFLTQARDGSRRAAEGDQDAPHLTPTMRRAESNGAVEVPTGKVPLPVMGKLLLLALFLIYAATYTMPTVQPYMAGGYADATDRQQLLLAMLVLQNTGDVLGRTFSPSRGRGMTLIAWWVALTVTFVTSVLVAAENQKVAQHWQYSMAIWIMPALCGVYYFARGLLVTTLYLRARRMGDAVVVHRLSLDMGFYGQMGALAANSLTFVLITVLHVL